MQLRRPRAFVSVLVLALAAMGGCNLIFGIQEGQGTGGGGSSTGATSSASTTSSASATSSASTTSSAGATSSASATSSSSSSGSAAFAISPSAVTLLAQTTLAFTTTGAPGAVTWSLPDSSAGAVTQGGIYTAVLAPGTFTLKATSGAATATASITVQQTTLSTVIVPTGELMTATGHGSQTHLAYATGTGAWWLFHDPASAVQGTGVLATSFSSDFMTWTPGEQLTLPMGNSGDGRDLSIAYRSIAGNDVVHVSQGYLDASSTLGRYHVRAVITGGHVAFGAAVNVNSGSGAPPDGTSTVIMPSGYVIDTTGYVPTGTLNPPGSLSDCGGGDVDVYTSDVVDTGTTSFDAVPFSGQVLWCVPDVVNARQLLALGDTAILLYVDGGSINPPNLLMSTSQNVGTWSPAEPPSGSDVVPPLVFTANAQGFGIDDWAATLAGTTVHAVRRLSDDTFEHRVLDATFTWGPGGAIPAQSTLQGSGLFVAPYGDGLVLAALGANGDQILYTAYDAPAGTWSSWQTLSLDVVDGAYLAGFAPGGAVKPALIWTQPAGASYGISGLQLP